MAKKWIDSKEETAKRKKFRKKAKEIQKGIKKPVAWCDCLGSQVGNYQEVKTKDDVCINCGSYAIWDKDKPRPSETTSDIEMHYLEDYTTDIPDKFRDQFDLHNYETEDFDAV